MTPLVGVDLREVDLRERVELLDGDGARRAVAEEQPPLHQVPAVPVDAVAIGLLGDIGVDVVPDLIAKNQESYTDAVRTFAKLDLTRDELPRADVIFCRDTLVHFSFADIRAAIRNFKRSGATYLIATTFARYPENRDISTGQWRQLNLERPPFNFPSPLKFVDEKCTHSGGVFGDKRLALWTLQDIPESLE